MITPYEKFKGFLLAILLGIIVYATLNAVQLAERYVEAKELEARYKVVNYQNDYILIIDKKERKAVLEDLKEESRTMILYEAPHHLKGTLKELYDALGNRKITLCRELTKKFETVFPLPSSTP